MSDTDQRAQKRKKPFPVRWVHSLLRSFRNRMVVVMLAILVAAGLTTVGLYYGLRSLFPEAISSEPLAVWALVLAITAAGTLICLLLSHRLFRPLDDLIDATERIAEGDFQIHVQETDNDETDFGRLQRSFNHMAEELGSTELFRNDFINNFSHEFKTPIVSIRGFARELQRPDLTEAQRREYVDIIAKESDRLANMAANILLLSKLENQQIVSDRTQFYLDEQLRKALLMLEKQWTEKDIELNIDLQECRYEFNQDMLLQVWLNLFGNAIKFTPQGGTIFCRLYEENGEAVVSIRDTGEGMTPEVRQHIFEKFYQGDPSHSGAGNGIGLNIVRRILILCNGRIEVESQPGEGSTFTVRLPR